MIIVWPYSTGWPSSTQISFIIPSTVDGIIKEICVDDGQPVEYGQTIVIVE